MCRGPCVSISAYFTIVMTTVFGAKWGLFENKFRCEHTESREIQAISSTQRIVICAGGLALEMLFVIGNDQICVVWRVTKFAKSVKMIWFHYVRKLVLTFTNYNNMMACVIVWLTFQWLEKYFHSQINTRAYISLLCAYAHVYDVCLKSRKYMVWMTEGFTLLSSCIRICKSLSITISCISGRSLARAASW